MVLVQNKYKNTLDGVLRPKITFITYPLPFCYLKPMIHGPIMSYTILLDDV